MVRPTLLITLLAAFVGTNLHVNAVARSWTHRDGRQVEAEFIAIENDMVRIRRMSDGRIFDVRLEVLSDADQQFAQATAQAAESTRQSEWLQQLVTDLDLRPLDEKRRMRMEDERGFAEAMLAWSKGLESVGKEKPSIAELLQLLVDYRSIWASDKHSSLATQQRIARMKHLHHRAIEDWNRALAATLESRVSEVQTVATMVDVPELFTERGFDQAQSQMLLSRLAVLPRANAQELSELIGESRLDAALLLIRNESLFDRAQPRPEAMRQSLAKVRSYVESSHLSAHLPAPAPAPAAPTVSSRSQANRPTQP